MITSAPTSVPVSAGDVALATADVAGSVISLPVRGQVDPVPVALDCLTEQELEVVFYAAGVKWRGMGDQFSLQRFAPLVVEQVNRLGLDLIREVARRYHEAALHHDWATWEAIMPSREIRHSACYLANRFRHAMRAQSGRPEDALCAWRQAVTA